MGREIITEEDVRKAEAETEAEEARRAGTSKLHGRPLDDTGNIELTVEPPVRKGTPLWIFPAGAAILIAAAMACGYLAGRSTPPAVVAHWSVQGHSEATPEFGTLTGNGVDGANTFCLYTIFVSERLAGTPMTVTDNKGNQIGIFTMAPTHPDQNPAALTLVEFKLQK